MQHRHESDGDLRQLFDDQRAAETSCTPAFTGVWNPARRRPGRLWRPLAIATAAGVASVVIATLILIDLPGRARLGPPVDQPWRSPTASLLERPPAREPATGRSTSLYDWTSPTDSLLGGAGRIPRERESRRNQS